MVIAKDTSVPGILLVVILTAMSVHAQHARGELRIEVRDPQGSAVATAAAELISDGTQFRRTFQIAHDGQYVAQDIPFCVYRLTVKCEAFALWAGVVEVRSEV